MSLRAAAAWACAKPLQIVAGYAASGLLFRLRTEELATAAERLRWLRWTAARLACCGAALALRDAPAFRAVVLVVGVFATYAHNARGRSPTARRAAPGTVALVTGRDGGHRPGDGRRALPPRRRRRRARPEPRAGRRGGAHQRRRARARPRFPAPASSSTTAARALLRRPRRRPRRTWRSSCSTRASCGRPTASSAAAPRPPSRRTTSPLLRGAPGTDAAARRGRDCRVVVVSSSLHRVAARALDALPDAAARRAAVADLRGDARAYGLFPRYALSKLMNVLHARALARRRPAVAAIAVHPGCVYTDVTRSLPWPVRAAHALAVPCWLLFQKLPPHGAHATVHAALAPELAAAENAGGAPTSPTAAEAPGPAPTPPPRLDASAAYAGAG
ncbi:hypothetical protein JL720_6047 [Aureococcus anophagefferens]|nr:hypothetical protein JL720_6047 [Aureococcus anophagefferens]